MNNSCREIWRTRFLCLKMWESEISMVVNFGIWPAGLSADHMGPAEQRKQLIVNARYWYYPLQINSWLK